MKPFVKFLLCFLAAICWLPLFSQTENHAVVSADNLKILYMGIDNPMSIAVPGVTNDKINVKISNGTITGNNGRYIVKVQSGTEATITVMIKDDSGKLKPVGSSTFQVKRVPEPQLLFGERTTRTHYFMTKEEIIASPTLQLSMEMPLGISFEIVSFVVTFVMDGEGHEEKITGRHLSPSVLRSVMKMKEGDKFYLEEISVKGPDGIRKLSSGITVHIVDQK